LYILRVLVTFEREIFVIPNQPSASERSGGINEERFLSALPFQANRFALIPRLRSG
jgi:hypothetical protein